MSTSSNTMILPTASTSIGVARAQINDSFLALLQNFYSGSRPASTNITYEGAGFSPPNGTLWVDSTTGTLYKADSVFGKNATLAPFSRYGIGYRIEPSLNSANTNQSSYEVGELISVTATGIAQADARLYMKFSNSSPHFIDVGVAPTGSITSTMLADGSITSIKLASGGTLFYDSTGGKVGIGTSSPQTPLQVVGAGRFGASSSQTTGTIALYNDGNNGTIEVFAGNNSATKRNLLLQTYGGNIGIGTASPDALLTVNGRASFGPGAVGTPSIAAFGDLNTGFWFPGSDILAASTAGSERMRVVANGNIGIGTTSPSFPLSVAGIIHSSTGGVRFPDGTTQATAAVVATATILDFAGYTAPSGYLLCDGAAVSRTTYAALFSAITAQSTVTITIASPGVVTWNSHPLQNGDPIRLQTTGALPTNLTINTTYYVVNSSTNSFQLSTTRSGSAINTSGTQSGTHTAIFAPYGYGDNSTTFNLPDLRGRVTAGRDNMGGTAANRLTVAGSGISGVNLGESGGNQTHTLTTAQMPSHSHTQGFGAGSVYNPVGGCGSQAQGNTGSTGNGDPHLNTQPTTIVNKIIKT